jgi:hypothetical protein
MSLQDPVNIGHDANRDFLLQCVLTEVNLGLRFCRIMRSARASPDVYSDGEKRALLALQRADEYMWKLHIAHRRFDQLTSQVERLRFELLGLKTNRSDGELARSRTASSSS